MIKKQVKTKYFDINSRFIDFSTAERTCASFNKMFADGDDFTPVESVIIDQQIRLATCICRNHRLQQNEVVEFEGADIADFNSQYRVVDIIDSDTFTFAYNETSDVAITGEIQVKLAACGWTKHAASNVKSYYVSNSGATIFIEFDTNKITFYQSFGGTSIQATTFQNESTFKFFGDDFSFNKTAANSVFFMLRERVVTVFCATLTPLQRYPSTGSAVSPYRARDNANIYLLAATYGATYVPLNAGTDIVLLPILWLSNSANSASTIMYHDISGGIAAQNYTVVNDGDSILMLLKFTPTNTGYFIKLSDWY